MAKDLKFNSPLSYKHFRSGIAWIILIVGIVCYYFGYFQIDKESIYREIVLKIADVLVIGVIVGYLSNAAQFLGIFKQDLQEIIYGEKFIKARNDIGKVWENISTQLFKSKFPAISKELLSIIQDNYFPQNNDISYINDYNVRIELTWADNDHKFVRAITTCDYDLIAENESNFVLPYKSWISAEGLSKNDYYIRNIDYTVNGNSVELKEETSISNDGKKYQYSSEVELSGSKKYEVTRKHEKQYLFEKDHHISFRAKHIVNKLVVRVSYPNDMNVEFVCRGTIKDFKETVIASGVIEERYKGIILPRQGYVFVLSRK